MDLGHALVNQTNHHNEREVIMKIKLLSSNVTFVIIVLSFLFFITFITANAALIGNPASLIFVSQGNRAEDTENCGYTPWRTCRTIQQAIYRIRPGGIIAVFPGTYQENILVDKPSIIIVSFDGAENTIIDGSSATDETVSEAMRIISDGVTVGWRNSSRNGFTFRNSVASGLFNTGSNVIISGNAAENNGARGFQFGLSSVDDSIDTSNKDIPDDPLNGATKMADAALQTQSNVTVNNNLATDNTLGGFYFSAFDDSVVRNNTATSNRGGGPFLGQGSGFWIDSGSNRDRLEENVASNNSGDGIFYRRGFGTEPAGLVTDQTTSRNITRSNGRHGIIFMGNNIVAQDNLSESNQVDGFRFLGFDQITDVSYNSAIGNSGAGIGIDGQFSGSNSIVLPLNFDENGIPVEFGGFHHNLLVDNQSHGFNDPNNDFTRCGIANTLDNGTTIEISHNFWGDDQNICDFSDNTIVQINPVENDSETGVRQR